MTTTSYAFRSVLAGEIGRFLSHHRALGKRFDNEESALKLLDRFLFEHGVGSIPDITPMLLETFLASRPRTRARSYNHLLSVLGRLFRWLVAQDVLAASPLQARPRRSTQRRTPFLFQPAQVKRLLGCAASLRDYRPRLWHRGPTYRMIFALMYGLGLRVGEVSRLCHKDLDPQRRCLHIRQTKFLKSRLVPFGPRMADALDEYLRVRWSPARPSPSDPLFTLTEHATAPICPHSVSRTFQRIVPELDLTVPAGVSAPRLHCLRHSFAVSTLLGWYREGVNPGARLLHLSTFLGHVNPASTAVYLTITAELLEQANRRFERFAAPSLKGVRP